MRSHSFHISLILCVAYCLGKELPSFIHVCHENDPNVNTCMMASIEELRPYLRKGVPEHQIPSLEPLILEDLLTEKISDLNVIVSNVTTFGAGDFFVRDLDVNWNERTMELHIDLPKLRIYAHYEVDGRVLVLPIKGKGDLEANITDITSEANLRMDKYEVNGENHLKFSNVELKAQVGGGQIRLEHLFNGDKIILGIINDLVNKNLQMFIKEIMPMVEKGLAKRFMDIGNSIVEPYRCDQLFPQ